MEYLNHLFLSEYLKHGSRTSPIITATMLIAMTLKDAKAKTTRINNDGGMHIITDPIVPRGILYGLDSAG